MRDSNDLSPVQGQFNYLDDSTESSLYRNGKVYLRRDTDGNDSGMHGVKNVAKSMPVFNARHRQADEGGRTEDCG